jgi:hypothetical protein
VNPWDRIWSRLTAEEKRLGTEEYVRQCQTSPEGHRAVNDYLAKRYRTRPETVAKWPVDVRAQRLGRSEVDPVNLASFVISFFVKHRTAMLTRFLDVAEIPHMNCVVDPRTSGDPSPLERVVLAVKALEAEFPTRDVQIYLDTLELQGAPAGSVGAMGPAFANVAEARRIAARAAPAAAPQPAAGIGQAAAPASGAPAPLVGPSVVPPSGEAEAAALAALTKALRLSGHVAQAGGPSVSSTPEPWATPANEPYLADPEDLTALDEMIRDAAAATADGIVGSPSFRRLREIVDELIRLNSERSRSWSHRGFLDVLEGRPRSAPPGNDRQRGWWFVGALDALARHEDRAGMVALFDGATADGRRLLGARHEACRHAVAHLFDALAAHGRLGDALSALTPIAAARGKQEFLDRLLEEAKSLLSQSRPLDATPILSLLFDAIGTMAAKKTVVRPEFVEEVTLTRSLAMRLHGGFDVSRAALEGLLSSTDRGLVARAHADLGLVDCRVRSLSEVRLPTRAEDLPSTARSLAPGREHFAHGAVDENPMRAQADFCLGVLALCEGADGQALAHLERAAAAFSSGVALPEGHGVAARARLGFALALSESLDSGRAREAAENLVQGARERPQEAHVYLLSRALAALSASSPEVAFSATVALYEILGERLLDAALDAGLVPAHEALRETLLHRCADTRRPKGARGDDAEALLRDALLATDLARAERALDVLEDLADDADGRKRLLAVLSDRRRYDPAWDAEEAMYSRVRCLESEGHYEEAARTISAAGHEILSRDPEHGIEVVEDLFERIDGYGVPRPDPSLDARAAALRRPSTAPSPAPSPSPPAGRIYFVGGNEVQEQYATWLREEAARRWPGVEIQFEFTGWSGNWGPRISAIEGRIQGAHAVVVMRFIRTMLGRTVRALCGRHGRPWVACTGHGRVSLLRAVERAVSLLPDPRG